MNEPTDRQTEDQPTGVRLQKVLSQAGVASRRAAEDLIRAGRVEVNGQVVTILGTRVDPSRDVVRVDGERVPVDVSKVYLALNKPRGVVSTMSDPQGRPCLGDLVRDRKERLYHVGRLDTDTEGLLLLVNDGEFAHRMAHPSYEVPKTYVAEVPGPVPARVGRMLRAGIELEDGPARVDSFRVLQQVGRRAMVELVLHEGRKHIVRRMLAEVGHPVRRLARTAIGPVKLGNLRPGETRPLTRRELGQLLDAVGL
ncbi:pseudouridine synthase [Thermasporomyces composti]|jgi:23S rRNA pseudouridine2605 synthase|uniref:RNA pseudouridylate synthase n=1 Tax=Thermasporomyces composti TaxID=696763 RepID=A0A3D9VIJ4_THECX|nr:pseudouridine synthase [Thermasporomyces composti]REF38034.1 23S rRNA pseudouridine2605 synthase [Thermasporomyces composti]